MVDEESGLPYYYHTKTGETVWERPTHAFVIPLRVLQVRVDCMLRRLKHTHSVLEYCPQSPSFPHESEL